MIRYIDLIMEYTLPWWPVVSVCALVGAIHTACLFMSYKHRTEFLWSRYIVSNSLKLKITTHTRGISVLKTLISVFRLLPKKIRVNFVVKYLHVYLFIKILQIAKNFQAFANTVKYEIFLKVLQENFTKNSFENYQMKFEVCCQNFLKGKRHFVIILLITHDLCKQNCTCDAWSVINLWTEPWTTI